MARPRKQKITIAPVNLGEPVAPVIEPKTGAGGTLQPTPRPIDESLSRRRITMLQHAVARRYHIDHTTAFSAGMRSIDYSRRAGVFASSAFREQKEPLTGRAWREATLHVKKTLSEDHVTLLTHVIIDEIPASHAATRIGKPARNGIEMLRQCLNALAEFYAL